MLWLCGGHLKSIWQQVALLEALNEVGVFVLRHKWVQTFGRLYWNLCSGWCSYWNVPKTIQVSFQRSFPLTQWFYVPDIWFLENINHKKLQGPAVPSGLQVSAGFVSSTIWCNCCHSRSGGKQVSCCHMLQNTFFFFWRGMVWDAKYCWPRNSVKIQSFYPSFILVTWKKGNKMQLCKSALPPSNPSVWWYKGLNWSGPSICFLLVKLNMSWWSVWSYESCCWL